MKVLKFQANWCQPCKVLSGMLKDTLPKDLDIEEIDIDSEPGKTLAFGIRGIPTLVLMDANGVEVERLTGLPSLGNLKNFLNQSAK